MTAYRTMNTNGEFKGTTKQAIADLKEEVREVKVEVKSLNKRFWIFLIIGTAILAERLPSLLNIALAR